MRHSLAAALIAATTLLSTAHAAPRDAEDREVTRLADRLNDPRTQSAVSGMVVAVADMVMGLRIDTLREAAARIDPEMRADDDARTLGDVVRRSDPDFRERLAGQSRVAASTMGAMATGIADMLPELRAMAERMGRQIEATERRLPR